MAENAAAPSFKGDAILEKGLKLPEWFYPDSGDEIVSSPEAGYIPISNQQIWAPVAST